MKKKLKSKRTISLVIAIALSLCLIMAGCGNNTQASGGGATETDTSGDTTTPPPAPTEDTNIEPVTWNVICSWVEGNYNFTRLQLFKDIIEKNTNGLLTINILGGPEVVPETEQAEATINGVADATYTSSGYAAGYIPIGEVVSFSNMNYDEMYASGGIDFLRAEHAKAGLFFYAPDNEVDLVPFNIYTNDKIDTLDGLKGLKIRASQGIWADIATNLGMVPSSIVFTELFSALEQGLVEGYMAPAFSGQKEGFFEFTKHKIMPGIGRGGTVMLFNLNSWNALDPKVQGMVLDSIGEIQDAWGKVNQDALDSNVAALEAAGGSVVTLSDADAAKLNDTFYEAAWASFQSKNPDADIEKLKALFVK